MFYSPLFEDQAPQPRTATGCCPSGHPPALSEQLRICSLHHVSCSPSKIPYVGFSPVRLQTGIQLRPSLTPPRFKYEAYMHPEDANLYATKAENLCPCGPKGHDGGTRYFQRSSPEALDSPLRYVVAMGHRLLWPHPRLSALTYALFPSSIVTLPYGLVWAGTERFPNLIRISFTSCHLPYPGDSSRCSWLLLPC